MTAGVFHRFMLDEIPQPGVVQPMVPSGEALVHWL
jgi:hypothetical protein